MSCGGELSGGGEYVGESGLSCVSPSGCGSGESVGDLGWGCVAPFGCGCGCVVRCVAMLGVVLLGCWLNLGCEWAVGGGEWAKLVGVALAS